MDVSIWIMPYFFFCHGQKDYALAELPVSDPDNLKGPRHWDDISAKMPDLWEYSRDITDTLSVSAKHDPMRTYTTRHLDIGKADAALHDELAIPFTAIQSPDLLTQHLQIDCKLCVKLLP